MGEPKLESEERMDRIELAVSLIAEKLEMSEINSVLKGEPLPGAEEKPGFGGIHYPAASQEEN